MDVTSAITVTLGTCDFDQQALVLGRTSHNVTDPPAYRIEVIQQQYSRAQHEYEHGGSREPHDEMMQNRLVAHDYHNLLN